MVVPLKDRYTASHRRSPEEIAKRLAKVDLDEYALESEKVIEPYPFVERPFSAGSVAWLVKRMLRVGAEFTHSFSQLAYGEHISLGGLRELKGESKSVIFAAGLMLLKASQHIERSGYGLYRRIRPGSQVRG